MNRPMLPYHIMKRLQGGMALIALSSFTSLASEADNFTGRDRALKDALPVVDAKMRGWLNKALAAANRKGGGCDRRRLFHEILKRIGGSPLSHLESWADDAKELDRYRPPFSKSIYAKKNRLRGPFSQIVTTNIRLNGIYIGVDKLGHFVNQGHGYAESYEKSHGDIDQAYKRGEQLEGGIFGLMTTGVRAYADLAANYQGFLFWRSVLDGPNPLIGCDQETSKFRFLREFTFADYVNESWDESINCSEFIPSIGRAVNGELKRRGVKCPVDEAACLRIAQFSNADRIVSPRCLQFASESDQKKKAADPGKGDKPVPPENAKEKHQDQRNKS